jgi:hypothetical protein
MSKYDLRFADEEDISDILSVISSSFDCEVNEKGAYYYRTTESQIKFEEIQKNINEEHSKRLLVLLLLLLLLYVYFFYL